MDRCEISEMHDRRGAPQHTNQTEASVKAWRDRLGQRLITDYSFVDTNDIAFYLPANYVF